MKTQTRASLFLPFVVRAIAGAFLLPEALEAAEDFQGAEAVLRAAAEASAKTEPDKKDDPHSLLRQQIKEFGEKVNSMPPAEAAQGWLALVDQVVKLAREADRLERPQEPVGADDLIRVLPPPAAWDALGQAISKRPAAKGSAQVTEFGLQVLAHTLNGNPAAREKAIAQLQEMAEKATENEKHFYRNILEQLSQAILAASDDPAAVLKALERQMRSRGGGRYGLNSINVPNLSALVGTNQAEAFLRRVLVEENVILTLESGTATHRLAQKLALELVDKLKSPQWQLVNSLDAVELYEALQKRFSKAPEKTPGPVTETRLPGIDLPEHDPAEMHKQQATLYYLLGLIARDRTADAVSVAQKLSGIKRGGVYLPPAALKAMETAGYTRNVDDFLFELLTKSPDSPFWPHYVQIAAKAGRTDRMLTLARATATSDQVSRNKRATIHQYLFRALLAADQIDDGVKEIQRLIALRREAGEGDGYESESAAQLGLTLARLGVLLEKPAWIDEGIAAVRNSVTSGKPARRYGGDHDTITATANLLTDLKRGAEAETMLKDGLASAVRPNPDMGYGDFSEAQAYLIALAGVYQKAGRHADVIVLLDRAPYWGAKDLAALSQHGFEMGMGALRFEHASLKMPEHQWPLPYIAAEALAATGRKPDALKIIIALLDQSPGHDASYDLLLRLAGDEALARLDQLFALDPFEERPLIWKAELLRKKNQLPEAEKIARQAISIDPSDGEQGPGNRMRVYAVLAEIRAARGDQKEADFLRGAVKAIRLAETADRYYEAGLLKRAVKMYQDSLTLFADAYCIQSRLAVQLAELGQHEAAEAHYRRAYELMPDSFGRVESHCFGCERAFDGQRAQSLAEKVFSDLAAKSPNKPQVHYLLGYLRFEQDRHADALPHFRTAVKLDRDYLNAWGKISQSARHTRLPAQERNEVVLNILRLDPFGHHAHPNLENATNLREVWNLTAAALSKRPSTPEALYELSASKAQIEKQAADPERRRHGFGWDEFDHFGRDRTTPGEFIAQNGFIAAAKEMIASRYGGLMVDDL
jgi:tetratricopeptide (TPR) repeat protein